MSQVHLLCHKTFFLKQFRKFSIVCIQSTSFKSSFLSLALQHILACWPSVYQWNSVKSLGGICIMPSPCPHAQDKKNRKRVSEQTPYCYQRSKTPVGAFKENTCIHHPAVTMTSEEYRRRQTEINTNKLQIAIQYKFKNLPCS